MDSVETIIALFINLRRNFFFFHSSHTGPVYLTSCFFSLPPAETLEAIRDFCTAAGCCWLLQLHTNLSYACIYM